jgi:hypothetical protein
MRIAQIYPTFEEVMIVATELGLEFGRQGHEVHFVTANLFV